VINSDKSATPHSNSENFKCGHIFVPFFQKFQNFKNHIQNGSKTCFNIFFSVFGLFGVILNDFPSQIIQNDQNHPKHKIFKSLKNHPKTIQNGSNKK